MTKGKRPGQGAARPALDYYEYKRQYELTRMRQHAGGTTIEAEKIEAEKAEEEGRPQEPSPEKERKSFGSLFSGLRRAARRDAASDPESAGEPPEGLADTEKVSPEARRLTPEEADVSSGSPDTEPRLPDPADVSTPDAFDDVSDLDQLSSGYATPPGDPLENPENEEISPSEGGLEISNPFASTIERLKQLSKKIRGGSGSAQARKRANEESAGAFDTDEQVEGRDVIPSLTMALSVENEGVPKRRRRRSDEDHPSSETVGASPDSEEERDARPWTDRTFMRPDAARDFAETGMESSAGVEQSMNDSGMNQKAELSEKLGETLDPKPMLSRRERKAQRAAESFADLPPAENARRSVQKDTPAPPDAQSADEGADPSDGSTRLFKPLRSRVAQPAAKPGAGKAPANDADYDGDEDYDDDVPPSRGKPRFGGKRRVYLDEEIRDEDDYDEDDYEEYEDDYDEDDWEEDARAYPVSFGKRLLSFLKGLLIVVLIFALLVLTLRQLEASGVLSLNGMRDTVGQLLPLDSLFPKPQQPEDPALPTDAPGSGDELDPAPAETAAPLESPAPTEEDWLSGIVQDLSSPSPTDASGSPASVQGAEGSPIDMAMPEASGEPLV